MHRRRRRATDHPAGAAGVAVAQVDQPVPGVQHAGASPHPPPALHGLGGVHRLAVHLAVELEHRVAAQHEDAVVLLVGVRPTLVVVDLEGRTTSSALARASSRATSAASSGAPATSAAAATTASSSTDDTRTSGSTPADRRVARRAGEAEARSSVGWVGGIPPNLVRGRNRPRPLAEHLVDVAPAPGLAGLDAAHHRVAGLVEVRVGVLADRGVAAADVAAAQAQAAGAPR